MKFKGTTGEAIAEDCFNGQQNQLTFLIHVGCKESSIEVYTGQSKRNNSKSFKEAEADAELIADSFNTVTKCDTLPSELLKQRNELIQALKDLRRLPTAKNMEAATKLINEIEQ